MKYLVTGKEMQLLDKNTSEHFGVPAVVLMEQAAMVFVRELLLTLPGIKKVIVFAGLGNNGADGIAIARLLNQRMIHADLYTMQECLPEKKGSDLFELQKKIYRNYGYPELHEANAGGLCCDAYASESNAGYDCAIDALFGIGLSRPISGIYADMVERMNALSVVRVAVDIASGISADTGEVLGCAVACQHTITFSFGKTGMYFWPGSEYSGQIHVVPMGITEESMPESGSFHYFSPESSDLPALLPKRIPHSNKGTYGKLLVIAGGPGMAGACAFSAKAAYRSGTGLVSIFTHEINRTVVQSLIPEAVLHTWDQGMDQRKIEERLLSCIRWADAVVIGPGLSTSEWAECMVRILFTHAEVPVLADADALNLLSLHPDLMQKRNCKMKENKADKEEQAEQEEKKELEQKKDNAGKFSMIITPHLGEMSRLTGKSIRFLQTHLAEAAQEFAAGNNCTCVLKDFHTVTAAADGRTWINLSGNNGMATGGSGDVLSGIIGGLLAQGCCPERAAYLGVYLHGCAGDAIAEEKGCRSMMASDIIEGISSVAHTADNQTGDWLREDMIQG